MSTVTLADDRPLDPDDELLVAYLDGELQRKEQADLENRLQDDEDLRRRLQQLESGWELLDELSSPAPSLKLVESTLELVVSDIVKASPKSTSLASRLKFPLAVTALCLIGIAGAVVTVRSIKAQQYRRQLEDLAIVEHLDAYTHGSDLALMRQLFADPDWSNMLVASQEIGDIQLGSIADLAAAPVHQREDLIKSLPLKEMTQLETRWNQFTRFDEATRAKIRNTAKAVSEQADAKFLLQTMQAYALWRDRLPPELIDRIESGEGKERRDAIKEAISRTQLSISRRSSLKLDEDSIDWIYLGLQQVLRQRIDSGDQATIAHLDRVKRIGSGEHAEYFAIASIVMSGSRRGGGGRRPLPRPPGMESVAPLQPHEIETISLALPDRALDILDSVAGGDPFNEAITIGIWAEEAVRRKFPFERDDSTPLERYQALDDSERDYLDLMPPEEILRDLGPDGRRFRFGAPRP